MDIKVKQQAEAPGPACVVSRDVTQRDKQTAVQSDIVRGPITETLPPPGEFRRPIYLKTLVKELLKSSCLQAVSGRVKL